MEQSWNHIWNDTMIEMNKHVIMNKDFDVLKCEIASTVGTLSSDQRKQNNQRPEKFWQNCIWLSEKKPGVALSPFC